jgi:hypothetical protein
MALVHGSGHWQWATEAHHYRDHRQLVRRFCRKPDAKFESTHIVVCQWNIKLRYNSDPISNYYLYKSVSLVIVVYVTASARYKHDRYSLMVLANSLFM